MSYSSQIIDEVTSWESITANPHRFGGKEFNIGNIEIGHIHGDWMVDIPFTRKIRELLVSDAEAEVHHILPESGWISFYLRQAADVQQAIKLYRISYLQKRMRRANPEQRADYENEIKRLAVSSALKALLLNRAAQTEEDDEIVAS